MQQKKTPGLLMSAMSNVTFVWLALLSVFWGCAVGPNYRQPHLSVEPRWSEAPESRITAASQTEEWWLAFKDPEMDSLIERAIKGNLDLLLAQARIHEARATKRIQAASIWSELDATGSFSRTLQSQNAFEVAGSPVSASSIANQATNLFQPGFDASWEIDVFGGNRRSVESAQANLEASVYDRDDVRLTLLGDIASYYIDLRLYQKQVEIIQKNLDAQATTLKVTRDRYEEGLASGMDVAQEESQVESTASQLPSLETSCRQSIHRLGILLGEQPSALAEELSSTAPIPVAPHDMGLGMPSDLLKRRPDIRRDERKLAAAVANIGIATADLFPKFSLTGSTQLQSISASNVFSGESLLDHGANYHLANFSGRQDRRQYRQDHCAEGRSIDDL
jgi:outer membrane protein, multidrug efflux system